MFNKICIILQQKKTPRQCLSVKDGSVDDECFALRNAFFECKRSLVSSVFFLCNIYVLLIIYNIFHIWNFQMDNRVRFRGRKGY